jgi:PAS domain S-box-containing protein/putative nucleotidyltransferase with HDIG domain
MMSVELLSLILVVLVLAHGAGLAWAYGLRKEAKRKSEALRQSEERYRNLVERVPAVVYTASLLEAISPLYVSPQVEPLLGYTPDEFITDPNLWNRVIHPEDRGWVQAEHSRFTSTWAPEAAGRDGANGDRWRKSEPLILEYRALTRAGRLVWLRDEAVIVLDEHGAPLHRQGILTDITASKETEGQLHRQLQRIAALRLIDMAINSSMDLALTLRILLEQAVSLLGANAGAVLLLNAKTRQLEYGVGTGFRAVAVQDTRLGLGQGFAGQVVMHRRLVHLSIQESEGGALFSTPQMIAEGFIGYYGAPLVAKGMVKGVLELFYRTPFSPDGEWMDFLEALAGQAAIAIDNAVLFENLQQANARLVTAYDDTISGWARALELRDGATEGHSRRVMEIVVSLARELGVNGEDLVQIRRGALLHDIGKMGIPDQILLKPGRLTDPEWQIMRRHPVYSYEMLAAIDFLRPALDIPYCHHERWDGRGYPRGLAGEEIPLSARIFALVDVWDALLSDRPYRPAWPEKKVDSYLRQESGRHFDPKVVEAFFHYIQQNQRSRAKKERNTEHPA